MPDQDKRWLVAFFDPVSLFSLRMSQTTSKGGKTLVVPTPYAMKMALIDACFRAWEGPDALSQSRRLFDLVKDRGIRFRPPPDCVVQNTFVKVLDAERDGDLPFKNTIVYREFVAFSGGPLEVAINVEGLGHSDVDVIERLFWHINSLGKRGSFWQCIDTKVISDALNGVYTTPAEEMQAGELAQFGMVRLLDDFGDALCQAKDGFERISTYGAGTISLDKHRAFISSAIPYRQKAASKRFTWYQRLE